MPASVPELHEEAPTTGGRIDIERVAAHLARRVQRTMKDDPETGPFSQVERALDHAVARGVQVGEGPSRLGSPQRQHAIAAGGHGWEEAPPRPVGPRSLQSERGSRVAI